MKECITHHYACECREEWMKLLEAVAESARNFINDAPYDMEFLDDEEEERFSRRFFALKIALDSHASEDGK